MNGKIQIITLPSDIIRYIASKLNLNEIFNLSLTCKYFYKNIIDNKYFWLNLLLLDYNIKNEDIPECYTAIYYYKYISNFLVCKPNTILMNGSIKADLNLIRLALEKGANINTYNGDEKLGNPLINAIINGNIKILKYLIENGADINKNHYMMAVETHNLEILKYLIEKKDIMYLQNDAYCIAYCINHASIQGYFTIVKYLIEIGFYNFNHLRYTLMLAEEYGHTKIVDYLNQIIYR